MKNKGFTLIELLAVIVILAIIALIAVPIILNIIDDSRKESNERSIEMYAKGLENALAKHQLDGTKLEVSELKVKEGTQGREFTNTNLKVDYEGNVVCNTIEVYEDGKIYLSDCEVNGKKVEYTYGTKKFEPQYYNYISTHIGDELPEDATPVPDLNRFFEINPGLDLGSDDKVSTLYICFTKGGKQYCLKGGDHLTYDINKTILVEAFGESACSFGVDNTEISCSDDSLEFTARSDGSMYAEHSKEGYNFMCNLEYYVEEGYWDIGCGE